MSKPTLATVWLDGCSGCHMSILDMDERLVELSEQFDLVYSPLVDCKEFPEQVDITLIEGSVSSDEDDRKIRAVRARTRILVSLGDCAVTGNVPAMRNSIPVPELLDWVYKGNGLLQEQVPADRLPSLLPSTFCRYDLHGHQRVTCRPRSGRSCLVSLWGLAEAGPSHA